MRQGSEWDMEWEGIMGLDGVIRHPTGRYRMDVGWVGAQRDAVGKPCARPCAWRPG
jgi:hypothetical protein